MGFSSTYKKFAQELKLKIDKWPAAEITEDDYQYK